MAGAKKEPRRQSERVVPSLDQGTSRVSSAAGRVSPHSGQHTRVEQRSNMPSRQSSRSVPPPSRQRSSGSSKQSPRKSSAGSRVSPSPASAPNTKDTQFIKWVSARWRSLEPHQQQRFFSVLLLLLSLLLFGSLTIFRNTFILSSISKFFLVFFGWAAYPLAFGLVAFALAHLVEGLRNQHFIRWSLVIGLCFICLLLLLESRLFTGHLAVGVLAEVLITPLLGWPPAVGHVLLIGSLLIVTIITFRLTFGHVLMVAHWIQGLFADPQRGSGSTTPQRSRGGSAASTYAGQRPQYSRYGNWPSSADPAQPSRSGRRSRVEEREEDQEDAVEFEADFGDEDPLNDINIHKNEIGTVPRHPRAAPRSLNVSEHQAATRGANQQELPFNDEEDEQPPTTQRQQRLVLQPPDLEPLAPNPKKSIWRKPSRTPQPPQPVIISPWKLPDTSLLHSPDEVKLQMLGDDTSTLARTIQETLRSFRVEAEVRPEDISIGPTVIRFGIRPTGRPEMKVDEKTGKMVPVRDANGQIVYETRTRVSRIMALQNDLALVLEAKTIRMEAPVPGRPYVGVEIPNKNSRLVTLREVLESKEYHTARNKSKLAIALGRDVAGQVRLGDLARMPHLLIAGATGSGKSVMINALICSILTQATPDDVRLLMVDPKMVELNLYNGIPHLLAPVVIEVDKVVALLKNAIAEMERRYRLFSQIGVRNLDGYRRMRLEKFAKGDNSLNNLPAIVIIIDELADLMMAAPEEVEGMICRLAQLARATGIHLVIATQRPSVDVITGLIKANIPTRISFMVSSAVDSRTIIDMGGAERLLGRGDMLYLPADAGRPERIQAAFVADDETEVLVDFWRQQLIDHNAATLKDGSLENASYSQVEEGWEIKEEPSEDFELEDDLLDRAEEIVREYGRASISLLQRRLRIGYSRAARLIDLLEEHGIIGQAETGGRAREVLNNNHDDYEDGGHSLASEADDIIAEERARDEFLRQQATRQTPPPKDS